MYSRAVSHFAWPAVRIPKPAIATCTGGYYEDKWAQGSTSSDTYVFEFWQCVDTFIYFAHVLVTIPPVGWINAAHRNGANILGTFILEWEAGAKVCQELFKNRESAAHAAKQLARIAGWFGFEGWLVWPTHTERWPPLLCNDIRHGAAHLQLWVHLMTQHTALHACPYLMVENNPESDNLK